MRYVFIFILNTLSAISTVSNSNWFRRIKDGKEVKSQKNYMAYLVKASVSPRDYDAWICGGAIVSPFFIVTSAACMADVEHAYAIAGYNKYVRFDEIQNDECTKVMMRKVVLICSPKPYDFDYAQVEKWAHIDIAVVKVNKKYDFSDNFQLPAGCSWQPKKININYLQKTQEPGQDVIVLGWGHADKWRSVNDNVDYNQESLQYSSMTILDKTTCKDKYKTMEDIIDKFMVCTQEAGNIDENGDQVIRAKARNKGCNSGISSDKSEQSPENQSTDHSPPDNLTSENPPAQNLPSDNSPPDWIPSVDSSKLFLYDSKLYLRARPTKLWPRHKLTISKQLKYKKLRNGGKKETKMIVYKILHHKKEDKKLLLNEFKYITSSDKPLNTTIALHESLHLKSQSNKQLKDKTSPDKHPDFESLPLEQKYETMLLNDQAQDKVLSNKQLKFETPPIESHYDTILTNNHQGGEQSNHKILPQDQQNLKTQPNKSSVDEMPPDKETNFEKPLHTKHNKEMQHNHKSNDDILSDKKFPHDKISTIYQTEDKQSRHTISPNKYLNLITQPNNQLDDKMSTDNQQSLSNKYNKKMQPDNEPGNKIGTHQTFGTPEMRSNKMPTNNQTNNTQSDYKISTHELQNNQLEDKTTQNKQPSLENPLRKKQNKEMKHKNQPNDKILAEKPQIIETLPQRRLNNKTPNNETEDQMHKVNRLRQQNQGLVIHLRRRAERRQGICQNDHGGPLVSWLGGHEVLIGVASVFRVTPSSKCVGPFLFTSTYCNSVFLFCLIEDSNDNALKGSESSNNKLLRSTICLPNVVIIEGGSYPAVDFAADDDEYRSRNEYMRMRRLCSGSPKEKGYYLILRQISWNNFSDRYMNNENANETSIDYKTDVNTDIESDDEPDIEPDIKPDIVSDDDI